MAPDPQRLRNNEDAVLVFQGGGALGAYQAGVFEELCENGIAPTWLAGVSIGAINASIIAGNPPSRRAQALRTFWDKVSSGLPGRPLTDGGPMHAVFNEASAFLVATMGVPGFFKPRSLPPILLPDGSPGALSYYDTTPLRKMLEELIDFDLLNSGATRLSLGAVNIKTGNYIYFDTRHVRIEPEHIMASGALPPGLPPIIIDGDAYWDGGIVSNTPLQIVLDEDPESDLCVFQVDCFSAAGELPQTIFDVYEREKEIRFSSRTRLNTDNFVTKRTARQAIGRLLEMLPAELANSKDARLLSKLVPHYCTTVVHLIYRRKPYEAASYDYEFSRLSVDDHWKAGRHAVRETFRNPDWRTRRDVPGAVEILDLTKPHAAQAHPQQPITEDEPQSNPLRKGAAP